MLEGGCHCGAVRYRIEGEVMHAALCHCGDCRRHAGAPVVGWTMMRREQLSFSGEVVTYASSEHGRRQFCPRCGTGLFFVNEEALPGLVDVQLATLDDAEALPPQAHIQVAERLGWMKTAGALPEYERFPPGAA
ncbi:MAG: GFA family protein [Allosphingosinicella sp.]|uniref:GFA family protein n=1 Tax=Allosphingosinicella sp. TaxID=2823234 RepID=UPI0039629E13